MSSWAYEYEHECEYEILAHSLIQIGLAHAI